MEITRTKHQGDNILFELKLNIKKQVYHTYLLEWQTFF